MWPRPSWAICEPELRVFLSLLWTVSILILAIEGNDCFTQWSYRFGVIVSMALAFLSGWLYFWVGYRLVAPERQKGAAFASAILVAPLLALLGSIGVSEMWAAEGDPTYYQRNGVGPVNMVAFLAQSGGMLMGWKVYYAGFKRSQRRLSRETEDEICDQSAHPVGRL